MALPTESKISDRLRVALRPDGMPKAVVPVKYSWRVALGIQGAIFLLAVYAVWWIGLGPGFISDMAIILLPQVVGAYVRWQLFDRHLDRLRRRLIYENRWICLRCGYSLNGLPFDHRCPECGQEYEITETQRAWAAWLKKKFAMNLETIERETSDLLRMRTRATCIRCGHDLRDIPTRICPVCSAEHGFQSFD